MIWSRDFICMKTLSGEDCALSKLCIQLSSARCSLHCYITSVHVQWFNIAMMALSDELQLGVLISFFGGYGCDRALWCTPSEQGHEDKPDDASHSYFGTLCRLCHKPGATKAQSQHSNPMNLRRSCYTPEYILRQCRKLHGQLNAGLNAYHWFLWVIHVHISPDVLPSAYLKVIRRVSWCAASTQWQTDRRVQQQLPPSRTQSWLQAWACRIFWSLPCPNQCSLGERKLS